MMNSTNEVQPVEINWYYAICEILVAVFAVIGNALVIFVFRKDRRLRRRTNYYIVSLAAADLLVGLLGIPFAILSSIGLPTNLHACLFTVSTLVVLCTISIFCLVAVSVDRYWAILYPMGYSRNVRTKTAIVIISICWVAGVIVGFLPLLGWHKDAPPNARCFFTDVMDYNYLVFLYFGTIITPALLLAFSYAHIYRVVLKQLRRIVTMNPGADSSRSSGGSTANSGGTMLRMLGAAQKREVKATQNLSIIVLFFMICWIPLYTINCVMAFCPSCKVESTYMLSCIILSHLNSAGNPLLYAYHLKDFRAALKIFFCQAFGLSQKQMGPTTTRLSNNNDNNTIYNNTYQRSCRGGNDFQMVPKISTILKNSASLAAATTGESASTRQMWDIPEASDSSESFKEDHRMAMVRPATPYTAHDISQVNQAFIETSSGDECDDVFIDETFPFNEYVINETCLNDRLRRDVKIVQTTSAISSSSPQLSKTLYYIEQDRSVKFARSISCGVTFCDNNKPSNNVLTRSLSEDDGDVVRNSIGC